METRFVERATAGPGALLRTGSTLVTWMLMGALLAPGATAPARAEEGPDRIPYAVPELVPLLRASYGLGAPLRVVVTDDRVSPRRAVLRRGQGVEWTSQAARGLRIVFEAPVARSMVCDGLVHFAVEGSELRSGLLPPGETARFCELAPGTYPYRIELDAASGEAGPAPSRPGGVLVVRSD